MTPTLFTLALLLRADAVAQPEALSKVVELTAPVSTVDVLRQRSKQRFVEGAPLLFATQGPRVLALEIRLLTPGRGGATVAGTLVVEREGHEVSRWLFSAPTDPAARVVGQPRRVASVTLSRHLEVPAGRHHFKIAFLLPAKAVALLRIDEVAIADASRLLVSEAPPGDEESVAAQVQTVEHDDGGSDDNPAVQTIER